jgi:hypothetical protein
VTWRIDHLVVAATSLAEGAQWVTDTLGATPQPGGRHAAMGTHNRLLSLGPSVYLEIIAIDPDAPPPGRSRWFGLDEFTGSPRLAAWVARSDDLDAALAIAPAGTGTPLSLARGPYRWRMAVPESGRLPCDGVAPALIEWEDDAHPCDGLLCSNLQLLRLDVRHPEPLGARMPAVERVRYVRGVPALNAVIGTPQGTVEL